MPHPASDERLRVHRLTAEAADDFAEDVRRGLSARPKSLPPKYFYDELGSHLFDAICLLPEYYLTRAEGEIFARHAQEIVGAARDGTKRVTLFELGSGSATKTRRIIEALLAEQKSLTYVPVDISPAALEASASALLGDYASLSVEAYAADYDTALPRLGARLNDESRALVLFLGSSVGNFDRAEARDFLRRLRGVLESGRPRAARRGLEEGAGRARSGLRRRARRHGRLQPQPPRAHQPRTRGGLPPARLPPRRARRRARGARRDAP